MHFPGHPQNFVRSDITETPESERIARFLSNFQMRISSVIRHSWMSVLYRLIKSIPEIHFGNLYIEKIRFFNLWKSSLLVTSVSFSSSKRTSSIMLVRFCVMVLECMEIDSFFQRNPFFLTFFLDFIQCARTLSLCFHFLCGGNIKEWVY